MTNIKDVAKLAQVSATTVSRVLNDHPYVSEEKRQAVWRAMEKRNYQVNINAIHLSKGKTYLVGVVLPFINHPYFAQLIEGISSEAVQNNYNLLLFQTEYDIKKEKEALDLLKHKQIDALIICSRACDWETIKDYISYGPVVLCEDVKEYNISSTYVDHHKAFTIGLDYLYKKGHEKIGHCIGRRSGTNSKQRESAYRSFLQKINQKFRDDFIIDDCLYLEDSAHVMRQIQQMTDPPTALLVTSDQVAAGILTYCNSHGISVPDELAVIGFDNQPIAKIMDITTIEINLVGMGKRLFHQAVGAESVFKEEMPSELIERSTV
ncbi:LacI family DNA-binding transcriptional regulator [Virgibacillus ainsalahensis]